MTTTAKAKASLSLDDLISLAEGVEYADVNFGNGRSARVGSLNAEQVSEWEEIRSSGPDGQKVAAALLIARSLVDDDGQRVGITKPYKDFTDEDRAKLAKLAKAQSRYQEALLYAINRLNLLTTGAKQEAAAKNA